MEERARYQLVQQLRLLKKIHTVYQIANEEQKGKLLDAARKPGGVLEKLSEFGFEQGFTEGLLIGGKDFIESLNASGKVEDPNLFAEVIF